ncbi:hypothetical protein EDB84DRAFT_1445024 [Lactarius hengduanensis]|nr:hypothetical protein EDB84DRAFT_1445024 [Lactarius hengduanensis]
MSRSEVGSQPRGPEVADCWTRVVGQSDDKPGADMDTRRMLGTFNVQSALLDDARPLALTSGDMSGSTLRSATRVKVGDIKFTAGGASLSSSLTSWQDIGSVVTAFKLVAATIKTCQEAVVDVHGRNSEDDVYFENVLRIAGSALRTIRPRVPTISTPLTIATVAVSPPTHGIKIKRSAPITDVVTASNISEVHTGTDPTSFSGIRRESKRKDDLISKSPEFAQVSQSTIDEEEGSHWTWLLYS